MKTESQWRFLTAFLKLPFHRTPSQPASATGATSPHVLTLGKACSWSSTSSCKLKLSWKWVSLSEWGMAGYNYSKTQSDSLHLLFLQFFFFFFFLLVITLMMMILTHLLVPKLKHPFQENVTLCWIRTSKWSSKGSTATIFSIVFENGSQEGFQNTDPGTSLVVQGLGILPRQGTGVRSVL